MQTLQVINSGDYPAIKSLACTHTAVTETDFAYGGVCPAALEGTLLGQAALSPGDELAYWEDGVRVGTFTCTQVSRPNPHTVRFTAHDGITRLDKDISQWLADLTDWPYTVQQLLTLCADHCGVTLGEVTLCNGGLSVPRFLAQLTGRQLVQYVCQANACFGYMDPSDRLCFARLGDGTEVTAIRSATVSDFATAPIARVAVRQSGQDVGLVWPQVEGETYEILRNPLLTGAGSEAVQNIAAAVVGLSYTPATLTTWESARAGDRIRFTYGGTEYRTVVFSRRRSGALTTLKSTGNPSRAAVTALHGKKETDILQGRMTELTADLEGVSATLTQTALTLDAVERQSSRLEQTAAGLELRLEATEETATAADTRLAALEADADSLELSIVTVRTQLDGKAGKETVEELGEHFHFGADGMTISNSATGMGIAVSEERVAFTGGTSPTTVITPNEMQTTNLHVGSKLVLGAFSLLPRTNGNLSMRWTGGE